ncbi:MAG TPA: purine-nucleoside phosphorylase [Trueperaceae bacterium]|nr:purine-nucleoside phosphorylase [Trueperaceae bacterium]
MTPLHVRAHQDDVAPFVLLPGDPDRAAHIAERFFDDPRPINRYRQLLGFTGRYRGMPVTVQTTGMGCPSLAIVVEELVTLGARTLVRVGTCGSVGADVAPGDLVIAMASVPRDGTTAAYLQGRPYAPTADFAVTRALVEAAERSGRRHHAGLILTEDAFYATTPQDVPELAAEGVLAVEMEASALFTLGKLRGVRAGCALVASNAIGDEAFIAPETLAASVDAMVETALEAGLQLAGGAS